VKVSRRVIQAINKISLKYIVWPDKDRCKEISDVMEEEGFKGCIGFVDGTTIPLHQRPGIDGEVYWDQKKRYLINCQVICDCDKFITLFMTGWPGPCGDSLVFTNMKVHKESENYFDSGELVILKLEKKNMRLIDYSS
jgi:hypothetical protein